MDPEAPIIEREEIERIICQMAEVDAARLVTENNQINELHILASNGKGPRQIVRDIESLLLARFGISIDHKKISVAQLGDRAPAEKATAEPPPRVKIAGIKVDISGQEATFEVGLAQNGTSHSGSASGPGSHSGRLRLAALAALDAVRSFSPGNNKYMLEHTAIVQGGHGKIALVCVSAMTRGGEEVLAGSAMVKFDEGDAIVKATLAAINRHWILNSS